MFEPEKLLTLLAGDMAGLKTRLEALDALGLPKMAGELENLQERVGALDAMDLPGHLGALDEQLKQVLEALKALMEQEEESAGELDPTVVPNWFLMDREQAAAAWQVLIGWCGNVLRPQYALALWRPCWYEHPRLVVELSWACAFWHWAYAKGAPPTRAAEWHTRWWPHIRDLMRETHKKCGVQAKPATGAAQATVVMRHRFPAGTQHQFCAPLERRTAPVETWETEPGTWTPTPLGEWVERDVAKRPEPQKKRK